MGFVIACDLLPKSLNLQYDVDLTMHGKFSLKETCKRFAVLTTLFNSVKNLGCGRRKIAKFDGSRFIWTNTGSQQRRKLITKISIRLPSKNFLSGHTLVTHKLTKTLFRE